MSRDRTAPASMHDAAEVARARLLGQMLIRRLHGLLRSARIYDEANRTYRQQVEEFLNALATSAEEETSIQGMGDSFYVNGVRMRPQPSQMTLFLGVHEELAMRGLAALRFLRGVDAGELTAFLRLFSAARDREQGGQLAEVSVAAGILHIVPVMESEVGAIAPLSEGPDDEDPWGEREKAREMMATALEGTRNIFLRAASTGGLPLRQARRLLQPIVDNIRREEFSIIGLTALKDHDEHTFAHCVNVGVISIAIGQQLGLPRPALANLGVAGLLHDLGKTAIPPEVLLKVGEPSPDEWSVIQRHPVEGARILSRTPGLSALLLDTMRVGFEHHLHPDGGGYPVLAAPRRLSAFTRIVAVADVFDALTAHRSYRRRPFTGYEALGQVLRAGAVRFDRAVLWSLMRSVGLYPAGTIMRTSSGFVVLSVSPNPDDMRRPFCRVLERPDGIQPVPDVVESWEPMPADETVTGVIPPEEWEYEVAELLAA